MNREHIESSLIDSIGYDSGSKTLEVEFKSGPIWEYWPVPPSEFQTLKDSVSSGSYFLRNIRGKYQERRVG